MTVTDRRPPLAPGAGVNTIKLDIERTRDELASTLDDLFATFNVRVQIRSHPGLFAGVFVVIAGAAAGIVALAERRRSRAVVVIERRTPPRGRVAPRTRMRTRGR